MVGVLSLFDVKNDKRVVWKCILNLTLRSFLKSLDSRFLQRNTTFSASLPV